MCWWVALIRHDPVKLFGSLARADKTQFEPNVAYGAPLLNPLIFNGLWKVLGF